MKITLHLPLHCQSDHFLFLDTCDKLKHSKMAIHGRHPKGKKKSAFRTTLSNNKFFRFTSLRQFLLILLLLALAPPIFLHFRLKKFHQMQLKKCSWMKNPPLVCAHGGDSNNAFPNTMSAYRAALVSQVDCIEIDVSRSSDGVLFALHDRDLQSLSGNKTVKVGHLASKEIKQIGARHRFFKEFHDLEISTIEDALKLVSKSVQQVVLDAKVGPPNHEKNLAADIISIVDKTRCKNCIVWAKSDTLARDVINLSPNIPVGYIVMKDPSTGVRSNLLRIKAAEVVGVYHPLIDDNLVDVLHRRNKKVYAWVVDEEESMQKMVLKCIDAIVTGFPTLLQRVMQNLRTQCLEEGFSLP